MGKKIIGEKSIFVRKLSRQENKKFAHGVCVGCFVMVFNLCTLFILLKPYLRLPTIYGSKHIPNPIIQNLSHTRSEVYEIKGDIRIHGISSSIFIASASTPNLTSTSWTTKPYAQKMNTAKYLNVTTFTLRLKPPNTIPPCTRSMRHLPAVVFSNKGHAANPFHAFADVLFPLFLTSHRFNRSVLFLVTNHVPPWTSRYRSILDRLSRYDVVDIDREDSVLCFSEMTVGLRSPKTLFVKPSESASASMPGFRKLLWSAYALQRASVRKGGDRPRMLIISREKSRRLVNEDEIGNMACDLGFDAVVQRLRSDAPMASLAKYVNSFDVMVGVHGAGLTNLVFLPENALVIQIAPFGVEVEAYVCFKWPAESLRLKYLEYKVSINESSIMGKYPAESEVYRDPGAIKEKHNGRFHYIYLDDQDVNLDLNRFRETLVRALELVRT